MTHDSGPPDPALGPRLLFFSGGTALRGLSERLVAHTHNSIHLITPFDSGGSSAKLREAFSMPAVGDLRNRLLALADRSIHGHPEIYSLLSFRFPEDETPVALRTWLNRMVAGDDEGVLAIPEPLRNPIQAHLGSFRDAMPAGFDLRGASVGNLVLAGGYLSQGRRMDPGLLLFSRLVEVRGVVRPVVEEDLHLAATLADGRTVVGQHRLTGRGHTPPGSPIDTLFLTRTPEDLTPCRPRISGVVADLIREADVICYPVGSFYTSVIATLLPTGVATAIASADAPKLYVPNPGHDPEEVGLELPDKVRTLIRYLRAGAPPGTPVSSLLQYVLVDARGGTVPTTHRRAIEEMGVRLVHTPLSRPDTAPYLDDELLTQVLLSSSRRAMGS